MLPEHVWHKTATIIAAVTLTTPVLKNPWTDELYIKVHGVKHNLKKKQTSLCYSFVIKNFDTFNF